VRQRLLPVQGRPDHVRTARVAGLERQYDLAADLGQGEQALVGVGRAEGRPGADLGVAVGAEPGEADLHPAEPGGVDEVGDERGVDVGVAGRRVVNRGGKAHWCTLFPSAVNMPLMHPRCHRAIALLA